MKKTNANEKQKTINSLFERRKILEGLLDDLVDSVAAQPDDLQVVKAREGAPVDGVYEVVF